jgi:hypothetical protein
MAEGMIRKLVAASIVDHGHQTNIRRWHNRGIVLKCGPLRCPRVQETGNRSSIPSGTEPSEHLLAARP